MLTDPSHQVDTTGLHLSTRKDTWIGIKNSFIPLSVNLLNSGHKDSEIRGCLSCLLLFVYCLCYGLSVCYISYICILCGSHLHPRQISRGTNKVILKSLKSFQSTVSAFHHVLIDTQHSHTACCACVWENAANFGWCWTVLTVSFSKRGNQTQFWW